MYPITVKTERSMAVACSALLALLVSKFLGHVELRNAKNEKGHSERGKKQFWTVVFNVV
jgi:hypothetical protein